MITCPWCGTNYTEFQSNCRNCGGPLPIPPRPGVAREEPLLAPPPAPRPIADSFAWKLVFSDGWFIAGMVFAILGGTFTCVGLGMSLALVTLLIGIPFALLGFAFLVGGGAAIYWRYQKARTTVRVLQVGQAARGEIVSVEQNYNVRVNQRHPWQIVYRFQANGQGYQGQVSTLNTLDSAIQAGNAVYVLYLPDAPENNVIYPHP
ncbi:MAG: hypothetical protein CVU44_09235 [Chloroflexi bacterium HGW-Chloroflexi-6]|nr:MAG: hypothetical protein CVU44_09235 [Chloroflexi bacterium HGW-Chloroflexi-6]